MVSMFGGHEGDLNHEGTVRSSGEFQIDSSFGGERHILIIGFGSEPLKAIGINLIVGGKNNLGDVDMSSACPK